MERFALFLTGFCIASISFLIAYFLGLRLGYKRGFEDASRMKEDFKELLDNIEKDDGGEE